MPRALCHIAAADWKLAKDNLQVIVDANPSDFEAVNNLGVCLLYLGELDAAIAMMENLILTAKDQAHRLMEQAVFNLCTLYELRSDTAMEKKVAKLQQLHAYVGDAFHVESFKI